VVTPTGDPVIAFSSTTTVGKNLVIHHRNHLGVMSGSAIVTDGQLIDLTIPTTLNYGIQAQRTNGSRNAMWPGNSNADGMVRYTGLGNDRDPILELLGVTTPTLTFSGYDPEDINLDGIVKYTGVNNDRDVILTTIGGTVPTNTLLQQLP
jgi:hypothetical protein